MSRERLYPPSVRRGRVYSRLGFHLAILLDVIVFVGPWSRYVGFALVVMTGAMIGNDVMLIARRRQFLREVHALDAVVSRLDDDTIGPEHPMWPLFAALIDGKAKAAAAVFSVADDGTESLVDWHFYEGTPQPDILAGTWTCHICGDERPDEFISVEQRPLPEGFTIDGSENVRYCNDRPSCAEQAKTFSFFPDNRT